jgi:GWxTD domain-containing protein
MAVFIVAACARPGGARPEARPEGRPEGRAGTPAVPRGSQNPTFDATPLYRQMGMVARGGPFGILGRVGFLGSPTPDTTHVVVGVTFANTSLSFSREADNRFRAGYGVSITLRRDAATVASEEAQEEVLVGTYRETIRTDESLIHQVVLDVPPGRYTLAVSVRDAATQRGAQEEMAVEVPRITAGGVATPIPVVEVAPRGTRDSLPALVMAPSGTAIAGRDSIIPFYVESYDTATTPLRLLLRNEQGKRLWSDTITLPRRGRIRSGVVGLPLGRIGIGVAEVTLTHDGTADSASTYVFVGFGSDLPVATYDDMLLYLRYFATTFRIATLRDAPPEQRPAAWAEFVRATDSDPRTPVHEDLRAYFDRIARANQRYREEVSAGWLSDRGRVFVTLGEPDQVFEPQLNDMSRNRQLIWVYQGINLQLTFYDQTGTGRWRLTQSSEVRFESEFRRRLK